jgi:two-component system phosphate regulon sensor histidine kinase PhoR
VKAVSLRGWRAPALLAAATLVVLAVAGAGWALLLLSCGSAWLVGFHLHHLHLVQRWAVAPLDAPVPEGFGVWAEVFAAIHRRSRMRGAVQRDMRQAIERFRQAAEAIPDGVVMLDSSNRLQWANAKALEQWALDLATDRGQPIVNFLRQPEFLRYVASDDYREAVVVAQGRDRRMLALQLVPFGLDEKLLLSRDISRMESVARMRRDFIANISHELKTPLTVVSGFVETLQDLELEPERRARYLALMHEQAKSMQRLVDDLLTLSALESEQNPLPETTFALAPLLLERAADARSLSAGQHTIELDLATAATIALRGSRDELGSAIGNLLSNAIRYTPAGGVVRLAWRDTGVGDGVVAVTDSGIGIAPEHLPRVTERFYRVDRSRSRATGGTGLGLAIVKHVLLRHQGELEIESTPGVGSEFRIRLPGSRVLRAWATTGAAAMEPGRPSPAEAAKAAGRSG